jgi:hypothetical protein
VYAPWSRGCNTNSSGYPRTLTVARISPPKAWPPPAPSRLGPPHQTLLPCSSAEVEKGAAKATKKNTPAAPPSPLALFKRSQLALFFRSVPGLAPLGPVATGTTGLFCLRCPRTAQDRFRRAISDPSGQTIRGAVYCGSVLLARLSAGTR